MQQQAVEAVDTEQIARAAELVHSAGGAVALTGAGISTPSGIPDFRGEGGLWRGHDPAAVASLAAFTREPAAFYGWFGPLLGQITSAQPNGAHLALAALEQRGVLHAVVTQNIDGLHQRAGSKAVYELHGNLRGATCPCCDAIAPVQYIAEQLRHKRLPRCRCGGTFKPNVVLFGEDLPRATYWLALHAIEHARVLIITGSSLEVFPASELPTLALHAGAKLIIINKTPTALDAYADVVIHSDAAVVLPLVVGAVETRR